MSNGDWWDDSIAWLICHEYNLIPVDPLKYERVLPTDGIGSHFFANTSNQVKILIQYNVDELEFP